MSNEYRQEQKIKKLDAAIQEARRFIDRANAAKKKLKQDSYFLFGCKEMASAKRASMDLSNALVEVRR